MKSPPIPGSGKYSIAKVGEDIYINGYKLCPVVQEQCDLCLMVANMSDDPRPLALDLGGKKIVSAQVIKDDKRAEAFSFDGILPGLSVLLLRAE